MVQWFRRLIRTGSHSITMVGDTFVWDIFLTDATITYVPSTPGQHRERTSRQYIHIVAGVRVWATDAYYRARNDWLAMLPRTTQARHAW